MENRATLEVIAPSVEEAIALGVNELGLPEDAVDVEILDPGSRGLFGIGSRHARVRLIVKTKAGAESTTPGEQPETSQLSPTEPPWITSGNQPQNLVRTVNPPQRKSPCQMMISPCTLPGRLLKNY